MVGNRWRRNSSFRLSLCIVPLVFLSPAAEQNYKALTVPATIDSISR